MTPRDQSIDQEARELWRTLRVDQPPENLTGSELLRLLIARSAAPSYDRLVSPFLRPSQISRPPAHP